MRKLHKGLIIGGATLAVLVPAGLVAADQMDVGNGHGHGRGNGTMNQDCTRTGTQTGSQLRERDGTGPNHAVNSANRAERTGNRVQHGPMDGSGGQMRRGA